MIEGSYLRRAPVELANGDSTRPREFCGEPDRLNREAAARPRVVSLCRWIKTTYTLPDVVRAD